MLNQKNFFITVALIVLPLLSQSQVWTVKGSIPNTPGSGRWSALCFSLNNKIYVGGGYRGNFISMKDFWEYDPMTDAWKQKADLPGSANRTAGIAFAGNGKGYIGLGSQNFNTLTAFFLNDLWEYDPKYDVWTQRASLPDSGRHQSTSFVLGDKAYVLGGNTDYPYIASNDLWEYDMTNDVWTAKKAFPADFIHSAMAFTIDSMGYVVGGRVKKAGSPPNGLSDSLMYAYDTLTDTWQALADYCGQREGGVGFSLNGKGYVGLGKADIGTITYYYEEFCEYDPQTDSWLSSASYPHIARAYAVAAVAGNRAYAGGGWLYTGSELYQSDWAEFSTEPNAVQEYSAESIRVFPNPARDQVYISGVKGQMITVMDLQGRTIIAPFTAETNTLSLQAGTLSPGTYQVVCSGENGRSNRLILIQ